MAKPNRLAGGYVAVGALLALCYAMQPGAAISGVIALSAGMSACVALLVGPRINAVRSPWAWRFLAISSFLFVLGVMIRPWAVAQPGVKVLIGDMFTLGGYTMLILGLVTMLRTAGNLDRHAVIDGLIVSLGAAAPAVEYLALPAAAITGRPRVISWLAGLYPTIDILVIFIVINLAFSTAVKTVSFRLIAVSATMLLVGDVGYAIIGTKGALSGPAILDLPFLLGFVALGAAALHPSMARLSVIVSQAVQPWSLLRLSLIIPALVAPFVVLLAKAGDNTGRRVAVVLSALLTVALVARAVSAVHRLAETQARSLYQATHDTLTGLPNRAFLVAEVNARIADHGHRRPDWMVYLDLDGFKLINDHWGHETGDRLLQEVATRLTDLADDGCLVARIGGDEFIVAGEGDEHQATAIGERLLESLREPIRLPGLELVTTGSIGVVVRSDQPTAEEILRDADVAMYRSKDAGRDRCQLFHSNMRDSVRLRVETELALRDAIKQDQLWVAYQPLVRMRDEHVIGAEALIRWNHPVRGAIAPPEFISIAEETGLIQEIGERVLGDSLCQLAQWRAAGVLDEDFTLSVNVSAHQLADDGLIEVVSQELAAWDLPPNCLTIELTESGLMADAQWATRVLQGLRDLGVKVSVDDFGTGYSSLSYLSTLPITGVKIDRSFVSDLGVHDHEEIIARAIVAMSDSLGLEVTAEGVETREQYAVLRALGVARGQGWLWGKAIGGADFGVTHLGCAATPAPEVSHKPSTPEHRGVSV